MSYYSTEHDAAWGGQCVGRQALHPLAGSRLWYDVGWSNDGLCTWVWADGLYVHHCSLCWTRWRCWEIPGLFTAIVHTRCHICRRRAWLRHFLRQWMRAHCVGSDGVGECLVHPVAECLGLPCGTQRQGLTIRAVGNLTHFDPRELIQFLTRGPDPDVNVYTRMQEYRASDGRHWIWLPLWDEDMVDHDATQWAACGWMQAGLSKTDVPLIVLTKTRTPE